MSLIPTIVNYYGGKARLARQIISMFPEHKMYCEVFMGGASVFFQKPKSQRNVLNDYNSNLVNLFVQVRDNFDALAEKVYWTLYSKEEYKKFYQLHLNGYKGNDNVTRAMMYLFLVRASFNSQTGIGFSASVESNSANFNLALIQRLKLAKERLDSVVIENEDFSTILHKYDHKETLFYLDPPYYVTAIERPDYYEKVMTVRQHEQLQFILSDIKCKWIMSYDDLPQVVKLYSEDKFYIQRIGVTYSTGNRKSQSKNTRKRKISELIISNYYAKRPQLDLMDEADIETSDLPEDEKKSSIILLTEQKLEKPKNVISKSNRIEPEQQSLFS